MNRTVTTLALALCAPLGLAVPAAAQTDDGAAAAAEARSPDGSKTKRGVKSKDGSKTKGGEEKADGEEETPAGVEAAEQPAVPPAEGPPPGAVSPDSPAAAPTATPEPANPMVPTPTPTPAPPKPAIGDGFGDLPSFDDIGSADDLGELGGDLHANWDAAAGPEAQVSFPWLEHHGYFRLRADLHYNFDLDTYFEGGRQSSAYPPPLTETYTDSRNEQSFEQGAETVAGVNMRLRYQPTLHISEGLRVRSTFDILDNAVLGSTADGYPSSLRGRPDVELGFFSETQRSDASGVDEWRDAVRVKHLWGEWHTPLGLLSFGRTQAHWGLGMLVNSGTCLDCDFGDSIDRIMATTQLFDTYLSVSWDFPVEGVVGMPGGFDRAQTGGQAYDLDQRDDVNQWTVAIFKKPHSLEEKEKRARELDELRAPVFDVGLYTVIRNQAISSSYSDEGNLAGLELARTNAWSITPDLWFDFQYRPAARSGIRIQGEAAVVIGDIGRLPGYATRAPSGCAEVDPDVPGCTDPVDSSHDILRYGYALEIDGRYDSLNYGVHHGLASGDDKEGFGISDSNRLDDLRFDEDTERTLSLFRFDRDYHVDDILFREVIGAVSNAAYVKPYVGYNLVDESDEVWGFELSVLGAFAMEKESTPGDESWLGLEFGVQMYVHEFDRFRWTLDYSVLFPGEALAVTVPGGERLSPGVAQTLQMFLGMEF